MKRLFTIGLLGLAGLVRTAAWQPGQVTSITLAPGPLVVAGTSVTATVAASLPCERISIDFGDGSSSAVGTLLVTTLPLSWTHGYLIPGSFTVTARGQGNCRGVASAPLVVDPGPGPDLVPDLSMWGGPPQTATVGQKLMYSVFIRNPGTADAVNVVVRNRLPPQVDFVRAQGDFFACTPSGQAGADGAVVVTCSTNRVGLGDSVWFKLDTQPIKGLADNLQIVFGVTVDPDNTVHESNEANNTASVITTLRSPADLAITAIAIERLGPPSRPPSASPASCAVNTRARVRVVNNGPGRSPATTIRMNWNSGVARGDRDCPLGSRCSDDGKCLPGTVGTAAACFDSCAVPALLPGTSADIVFRINRDQELSSFGTATVDPGPSVVNDPNRGNNVRTIQ